MPKVEIDYSNTIIYKIFCKDPSIKDLYVGHTTNFIQRKYAHKQACNNIKSPYYNLKLYKTIRQHGNWSNWDMTIIQFYTCKNHLEALQKEQYHLTALNANLNSIEPFLLKVNPATHSETKNITSTVMCQNIELDLNNNKFFECAICNYNTCRKKDFNKHLLTVKHRSNVDQSIQAVKIIKSNQNIQITFQDKTYVCLCGKKYVDNSGLWRHKKKCTINKKDEIFNISEIEEPKMEDKMPEKFDKEMLIIQLLKQNQELQQSLIELSKKSINITNNTNTNNSHNKTFNLQFFLNEECKDALNISEFVSSIKVELEDLEATGRLGYVEGVSRIMNKNLKELDINKRPIHCSDSKREILYIKNDDQWIKEEETKPILKKAIKQVAYENIKQINEWKKKYPDCTDSDSRKNDLYLKIVGNSMSGLTTEEQLKNYEKIVSKVAKETTIDK